MRNEKLRKGRNERGGRDEGVFQLDKLKWGERGVIF